MTACRLTRLPRVKHAARRAISIRLAAFSVRTIPNCMAAQDFSSPKNGCGATKYVLPPLSTLERGPFQQMLANARRSRSRTVGTESNVSVVFGINQIYQVPLYSIL
jgi:hypothetical protein